MRQHCPQTCLFFPIKATESTKKQHKYTAASVNKKTVNSVFLLSGKRVRSENMSRIEAVYCIKTGKKEGRGFIIFNKISETVLQILTMCRGDNGGEIIKMTFKRKSVHAKCQINDLIQPASIYLHVTFSAYPVLSCQH